MDPSVAANAAATKEFTAQMRRGEDTLSRVLQAADALGYVPNQIASGQAADTYGGLGSGRTQSLSAHAQISALDSWIAAAGTASTRVSLASAGVQQVATLASSAWSSLVSLHFLHDLFSSENRLLHDHLIY